MHVEVVSPEPTITVTIHDMTVDDVKALIHVLDNDRNHPARKALYDVLRDAREELEEQGQ